MNSPTPRAGIPLTWLTTGALILAWGCGRSSPWTLPDFTEPPRTETALRTAFIYEIPAFGISTASAGASEFEVNIEAGDAGKLRVGERAAVFMLPGKTPVPCQVTRILKNVSTETAQALAWLESEQGNAGIPLNEFVYATIRTGIPRNILSVPREAIFIRSGKTWVVRKAKTEKGAEEFQPVQVRVGEAAGSRVEVLGGLQPGATVVTGGGIGYLYPEFKADAGSGD